ncbi:hypothetical protein BDN72DRAFT_161444 [Pluteus cervinus]|uniref:Uncharacterized protein n=1 Tax=Pluteus cervinus TaxID=181527 RepID=A0ACD3AKD8_9AGAR|nr:hypothetical protein BDN72DRAFT_161444 [Pluteus cervinus]
MSINIGKSTINAPNSQWNTLGPGGTINNNQQYDYRPITSNHYDHSQGNTTDNSTHNTTYNGSNHHSGGTTNIGAPAPHNPQLPPTSQAPAPIPGAFAHGQGPTFPPQTAPFSAFPPPPPLMSGQSYGYPSTPYGQNPTGYPTQFQPQPQQQFGAASPPPMGCPANSQPTAGQYPYNQHPYYAQPIPPSGTSTPTSVPSSYPTISPLAAPQSPPVEDDGEPPV